jgi:hypothetical protein
MPARQGRFLVDSGQRRPHGVHTIGRHRKIDKNRLRTIMEIADSPMGRGGIGDR